MGNERKSVLVAYVCWFFGGKLGLHLFYLERDVQAFLRCVTIFDWFSHLVWLTDLCFIPRYVNICNRDPEVLHQEFARTMRENVKPPFSSSRFISAITVSYLWGQLVKLAIPEEEVAGINWMPICHWLIPFAIGLGVWVVGNIGREQGSLWPTMATAYLTYLSRWYIFDDSIWMTIMTVSCGLVFDTFSKQWRRTPRKKRSFIRRVSVIAVCGLVYSSLWVSYFYFNGKITDTNGDEIPVHEAIHHFFTSPWWTDLYQSLLDTYNYAQHHGWWEVWKQIVELSDPQGEKNAYKILGVGPTSSQSEITASWRKLSREFHPDKVKDAELQREAQERFMEIQQAYEILSNIKHRRKRKNKKSVKEEDQ